MKIRGLHDNVNTWVVAEYILLFNYMCSIVHSLGSTSMKKRKYLGGCGVGHREGGVGVGQTKDIEDIEGDKENDRNVKDTLAQNGV